ncbi:hypothetical protein BDK51DRAFT_36877 [Blyttiomyces helicus]|uniref:Uncharacterized protein n=1 Tax=Blyttiomyces helicus TaxID=388810 RepID=A0A4P9WLZ9_9FUNG|nr:hypothetical protein BDK51DRAFT_36877 [Blyttiomyces helicus]|eukprot:RKO93462.1 hypothetical protein BDK51DRAFT_36877 [Blyttiomyces helicus]
MAGLPISSTNMPFSAAFSISTAGPHCSGNGPVESSAAHPASSITLAKVLPAAEMDLLVSPQGAPSQRPVGLL